MDWKYIELLQDYKNVLHKIPEEVYQSKNEVQIQHYANIEKHKLPASMIVKENTRLLIANLAFLVVDTDFPNKT